MKHGRKTNWTKDRWLAYKAWAERYALMTMRAGYVALVVAQMEDRED